MTFLSWDEYLLLLIILLSQLNFCDRYSSVQDDISPGANLLTSVGILVSGVCFLKDLGPSHSIKNTTHLCFNPTSVHCFMKVSV